MATTRGAARGSGEEMNTGGHNTRGRGAAGRVPPDAGAPVRAGAGGPSLAASVGARPAFTLHPRDSSGRTGPPVVYIPHSRKRRLTEAPRLAPGPGWGGPGPRLRGRRPRGCREGAGPGTGDRGSPGGGVQPRAGEPSPGRAGGHYLLRGAPLRRRHRARPGPGPLGAGSDSKAAGRVPRAPRPNKGSRWPGRSRWSVAWSVPRRGPGPEPPGPPGPHWRRGRRRPRLTDPAAAILLRGPRRPPGRRRKGPRERLPATRLIRNAYSRGTEAGCGPMGQDRWPREEGWRERAALAAASGSRAGAAAQPSAAAARPS